MLAHYTSHLSRPSARPRHHPSLISSAAPGSFPKSYLPPACLAILGLAERALSSLTTKAEPSVVAAAPVGTVLSQRGRRLVIASLPVTCASVGAHVAGEPGREDTADGPCSR